MNPNGAKYVYLYMITIGKTSENHFINRELK